LKKRREERRGGREKEKLLEKEERVPNKNGKKKARLEKLKKGKDRKVSKIRR
jgi:hypothetical protein